MVGALQRFLVGGQRLGDLAGGQTQAARRLGELSAGGGEGIEQTGDHPRVVGVRGGDGEACTLAMRIEPARIGDSALMDGQAQTQTREGFGAVVGAIAVGFALCDQAARAMAQAYRVVLGLIRALE